MISGNDSFGSQFSFSQRKKIICWGQSQLNMFMLQDDNRQKVSENRNRNKTKMLQCSTSLDVEQTKWIMGVKTSLLKWSGDPRVEKTQVRNCRRTWTSALWLYLRPEGAWVHSFIIHRLYRLLTTKSCKLSFFFFSRTVCDWAAGWQTYSANLCRCSRTSWM